MELGPCRIFPPQIRSFYYARLFPLSASLVAIPLTMCTDRDYARYSVSVRSNLDLVSVRFGFVFSSLRILFQFASDSVSVRFGLGFGSLWIQVRFVSDWVSVRFGFVSFRFRIRFAGDEIQCKLVATCRVWDGPSSRCSLGGWRPLQSRMRVGGWGGGEV